MYSSSGRGRKREYEHDSRHRDDRRGYEAKRARGSYSSRGTYVASSRGTYSSSSRGSYNSSSPRGSYSSSPRGSYSSSSRGSSSFSSPRGSAPRGSSSRGSYSSSSRGSYTSSSPRGSYKYDSRGSYKSDSRGSYRGSYKSDSRGSYSSRGDHRPSYDGDRQGSYYSSRGRGSSRSDRDSSRDSFRSPSYDKFKTDRRFSSERAPVRESRSPSYGSSSRFQTESSFRGGRARGSYRSRFPRENSYASRRPYSRDRGSGYRYRGSGYRDRGSGYRDRGSGYRGRVRTMDRRPRRRSRSPSPNRSYHGSDMSDDDEGRKHAHDSDVSDIEDPDRFPQFDSLTEVKPDDESDGKKKDLAAIILRLLMDEGGHMKVHDLEMELITSKNIQFTTSDEFEKFLSNYKDLFKVHTIEVGESSELGEKSVTGHSKITVCRTHSKMANSCKEECGALHLCKYRLLSECHKPGCIYGHDVRRHHHNKKVLKDHMLHRLSFPQLQQIFRNLYNRQGINIPLLCSFYNSEGRCRSEYRDRYNWKPCPFIHICKKYIEGSCEDFRKCGKSHSLYDKQTFKILERYGLNPDDYSGGKREILRFLRNKCQTSSDNASDVHTDHEDDISDDEEYKSWDEDEEFEEHIEDELPEEGGDDAAEENMEEDNMEHENEENGLNEKQEEGTEVEKAETENKSSEKENGDQEENVTEDGEKIVMEGKDSADLASTNKEENAEQEKNQTIKEGQVTDETSKEGVTEMEMATGNDVGLDGTEKADTKKPPKDTTKSPKKLELVKGKKRRVKQVAKPKEIPKEETEEPVADNFGATWKFSLTSQEEWKDLTDAEIFELEDRYQWYLESKMQNVYIGETEYNIDFSTFEGFTEIEGQEGIKLKRDEQEYTE